MLVIYLPPDQPDDIHVCWFLIGAANTNICLAPLIAAVDTRDPMEVNSGRVLCANASIHSFGVPHFTMEIVD